MTLARRPDRVVRRLLWALLLMALPVGGAAQAPDYRSLDTAGLRVRYLPQDSLLARRVAERLLDMPPLPGLPGVTLEGMEVVLAPDRDAFAEASGGRPPEWSAGVALPGEGRMVLPAWTGSELHGAGAARLLRHEWAHLGMGVASGGLRAPRWFSEGYAEWAGGWDRTRAWRLRLLLATGSAPPLDSLSLDWPGNRAPAESAYLLSASVVEFLVEASGEAGLEVLFRRWREGGRFEEALRSTYGLTSGQLEEDWRGWARDRYGWLYVLTHSGLAWGLLAVLLAATALLRRRYNKERMARLRARELPEAPAFWDPAAPDAVPEGDTDPPRTPEPRDE